MEGTTKKLFITIALLFIVFTNKIAFSQNTQINTYWPFAVGNIWLFDNCHNCGIYHEIQIINKSNKDSMLYVVLSAFLQSGQNGAPPSSLYMFKIEQNTIRYGSYNPTLPPEIIKYATIIIVDFADSSNIISFDSTVTVPAGTFEHCYVFSNGDIYAPNVGPIKDLVYAKVNGVEYGTYPSELTSVEIIKEHSLTDFSLSQNHPNPFNSSTVIDFTIPEAAEIKLTVFDVTGKEVRTILNSRLLAGNHSAQWDGTDSFGRTVASGIYFIHLQVRPGESRSGGTGQYSKTIKAIYTR